MSDGLPPLSVWRWALAVAPIVVLVVLVLRGRSKTSVNALMTTALAVVIGLIAFGASPSVVAVGLGKGVWTGVWILYVIWSALLLYHLAARVGLTRMGAVFSSVLPREVENVLIVAWIFPSFVQGVAGFGTPIAVAAPLLVSMGVSKVRAVSLPLIGYHWSVTFGSMGSSFYMGALTAQLTGSDFDHYANDAALMLGVNLIVAGMLVCLMFGGVRALRDGLRMVLVVGPMMAIALWAAVQIEPSIGSLSAGAAGFLGIALLRFSTGHRAPLSGAAVLASVGAPAGGATSAGGTLIPAADETDSTRREGHDDGPSSPGDGPPRRPALVLLPYVFLLVMVLGVFVPGGSRSYVKSHFRLGPSFPSTHTHYGLINESVDHYTPIALLGHPGTYIVLASVLGLLTYWVAGMWPRGELRPTLRDWFAQSRKASLSVIALASLATVMVDTGMVRVIAVGAADVAGKGFPLVAPLIGMVGSFTTGSTTSSNALFSALQRDVALLIGARPSELLGAQTAGGNIGNSLAPVVILIGASAVGAVDRVSEIFRRVLLPAAVLASVIMTITMVLVLVE